MTYYTTSTANLPPTPPVIIDSRSDPETIINEVCDAMQVARVLLNSKSRSRHVVQCRWLVWKILHSWGYTLKQCGDMFDADHTSVCNCLSKIDKDIEYMPYLQFAWNRVKRHFVEDRKPIKN